MVRFRFDVGLCIEGLSWLKGTKSDIHLATLQLEDTGIVVRMYSMRTSSTAGLLPSSWIRFYDRQSPCSSPLM
jgi:hypothetical protein